MLRVHHYVYMHTYIVHVHIMHAHVHTQDSVGGVFNTIARRASVRCTSQHGHPANEPPPDYPAVVAGRRFDLADLSDSDDDNAFTTEAPPDYEGLVQ